MNKRLYIMGVGWVAEHPAPRRAPGPYIVPDIPAYRSPLGTGEISSRSTRREDLKRGNCREVDPGEFKPMDRESLRALKEAERAALERRRRDGA